MDEPSANTQSLPAGTRLEEFVIERVLGSGGFGITYLARDTALGRQVVIKENLPVQFCFRDPSSLTVSPRHSHGEDADNFQWSLENFSKEAAMLASLDHPGIVRVLRSFQAFGTAYFVMPFVEGMALDELAKEREAKPFSEGELRGLLERVLDALGYLHERGIYHRDIKPGNILITKQNAPVLIDFGSARQRLSERSMTVVESPGYTPFEQLQSRGNVGPWSDLYALGGTLVKVMTREAPPKAMDRMRKDPYQSLVGRVDLKSRFKNEFLGAIDKALAVDEEERWQDAGEWQAAFQGEMSALPVADVLKYDPVTAAAVVASVSSTGSEKKDLRRPPNRRRRPVASSPVTGSEKKTNFVPWIVSACMVLGLIAVGKSGSNDREEVAAAQVRDAEQSAAQAERQKQMLIAQAKAREEAEAKAEREKQALIAQEKAKEEAEAKAEREKEAFIAQAKAKEEAEAKTAMEKRTSPGSKAGEERDFEIAEGVKMTFCWIPPGKFLMGSPVDEGRGDSENQHRVTISRGFWLAKSEVTQSQWRAVMGRNPSSFKGDDLPVETVSWDDIVGSGGFLERANRFADGDHGFSLPTEAQWEYACRAGTTGTHSGDLDQIAWYYRNAGGKTHPVGQKKANAWGLHDMQGNVSEWCADLYGPDPTGAVSAPVGATSGSFRVFRGGGWDDNTNKCRVANCSVSYSVFSYYGVGFRPARSSVPQNDR